MNKEFKDKIVLITGGTGSIGSELVKQILLYEPKQIRVLSRDENKQYYLLQKLNYPKNLRLLIGDIRDLERLNKAMEKVDIVIHAAALKHVPLCEYNFSEAIKTNIIGSQNVIEAALKNRVPKVIAISTDKAAYPNNVMGVSKLMMEKIFINANFYSSNFNSVFSCVRFGNILFSNGSVLPLWQKQIAQSSSINITDPSMTRFFISKEQAIELVIKATSLAQGGEIFVLKMPSIKIEDLANHFIKKFPSKIDIIKVSPREGEKKHEAILDGSDLNKKIIENDSMFIVLPSLNLSEQLSNSYQDSKTNDKNIRYENFYPVKSHNLDEYRSSSKCSNSNLIKNTIDDTLSKNSSTNW